MLLEMVYSFDFVVGRIIVAQRCPRPNLQNLRICDFTWQRNIADVVKIEDFEMGRLPWIIWVDPV